jgi:hypothetical protein
METIWKIGITWNIFFQNLGSWLKTPMEVFSLFGKIFFYCFYQHSTGAWRPASAYELALSSF